MCLNVVTRLQEDLLTAYQSIKLHYNSENTIILKNTLSQIFVTLPILGVHMTKINFYTHCW